MRKSNWIIPYVKENRELFALVICLSIITFSSGAALMFTSGHLISKSSLMPESIMAVYIAVVGVRAFGLMRSVFRYIERLFSHLLVLHILEKMRVRLYHVLEPQGLLLKSRYRTGDILGLLADDIEHLQKFYLTTVFPAIVSLFLYGAVVIILGVFSIPFAVVYFVLIGWLVVVSPLISVLYNRAKNSFLKQGRNNLYQTFTDAVFGLSDWMFSGRTAQFIDGYEASEQQLARMDKKKDSFVHWRDFLNQLVVGAMIVAMVYWSAIQSSENAFSKTFIAAFVLAIMSLAEVFIPVSSAISDTSLYEDSLERLHKLEADSLSSELEGSETKEIAIKSVNIVLEDVSFQYHNDSPFILNGVSIALSQGEKIAILGRSGSGKSTLLKLMQAALQPTSGTIQINGVGVARLQGKMPKIIAMLNQKPHLFNTTILNNIRLGNPNASDEEVCEVAKKIKLHDLIMSLPEGYHTQMTEMGARFSGGERQRVALARVLLQNTPVVILDEPTVGLDPLTERDLLVTIFETLENKTLIWVTHHLVGTKKMDRIIFLENGRIMIEGSHEDLLITEKYYRRLYELDRPVKV